MTLLPLLFLLCSTLSVSSYDYLMTSYWKTHPDPSSTETPTLGSVPDFYNLIHVGFAIINSRGDLNFTMSQVEQKQLISDIKAKQEDGVRVFISVGGPYSDWNAVSKTTLGTILDSLSHLLITYGFDGIDVNQQKMSTSKQEAITIQFVQSLSTAFPSMKLSLTGEDLYISNVTKQSEGGWNTFENVLNSVGNLTEFVQIMAFSEGLDPVSDYRYWSSGFSNSVVSWGGYPSSELLLGVPTSSSMSGYLELSQALSNVATLKSEYNIDEENFFGGLMTWNANADTDGEYGKSLSQCLFEDICTTETESVLSIKENFDFKERVKNERSE